MKNEEIKKVEETVFEEVKEVETTEVVATEPEKEKMTTKIAKGVKTHGKKIAKAALGIGIGLACFALGAKSAGKGDTSDYDDYSCGNDNESSSDNELE